MKDWFELKYFLYFRKKRLQSGLVSTSRLIECATCLFIYDSLQLFVKCIRNFWVKIVSKVILQHCEYYKIMNRINYTGKKNVI